jgi:hypothetical protein
MLSADIVRNREAKPKKHIHRIRPLYWTIPLTQKDSSFKPFQSSQEKISTVLKLASRVRVERQRSDLCKYFYFFKSNETISQSLKPIKYLKSFFRHIVD